MIKAFFQRFVYQGDHLIGFTETLVEFNSLTDYNHAIGVYSADVAKTHHGQRNVTHYFEVLRIQ